MGNRPVQDQIQYLFNLLFFIFFIGDVKRFQYFNLETSFFKKTFLKLTKIENEQFLNKLSPYKTALSEANVKTSSIGSTK